MMVAWMGDPLKAAGGGLVFTSGAHFVFFVRSVSLVR
jgi:hypothetical protein